MNTDPKVTDVNAISGSIQGEVLTAGRTVIIRATSLAEPWASGDRRFKCSGGGSGCALGKLGRAIFGTYANGDEGRIDRTMIEGSAAHELSTTPESVTAAPDREFGITRFTPPMNNVNVKKLSIEGLVMLYTFLPNYWTEPEGGIVSAAREELIGRGVIEEAGDRLIEWHLDDEIKEELAEVWTIDRMAATFRSVTRASRKRK